MLPRTAYACDGNCEERFLFQLREKADRRSVLVRRQPAKRVEPTTRIGGDSA